MLRSHKTKSQSPRLDLSIVPSNVFSLRGESFYELVEEITSEDIKDLLKIQKISTARCFLDTNPLDFLDLRSDDQLILQLQGRLSFKVANNEHVVLAGIKGELRYLTELLKVYLLEDKQRLTSEAKSTVSIDIVQQNSSVPVTPSSVPTDSSDMPKLSAIEHRDYLIKQIKTWWENNRHEQNPEKHQFIESQDYELIIDANSASIICSCRKKINLSLANGRHHFQLSNYYKHLIKSTSCTTLKRKRTSSEREEEQDDNNDDDELCSPPLTIPLHPSRIIVNTNNHRRATSSISDSSSKSKRKRI